MPYLPQQRVKMLWKDAGEPSKGQWYSGMVVQEGKEYGPHPQAVWEGVSVMWDADGSEHTFSKFFQHTYIPATDI